MPALHPEFLIAEAQLLDELAGVESDSQSLIFRRRNIPGGQRFVFRLRSTKLQGDALKRVQASLAAIRNTNQNLTVRVPVYSDSVVTTRTTSAAAGIGATTVNLATANGDEVGQYFTFANHTKAYQVTDVNTTTKVITFYPNLVYPVSSATVLTFNNMVFTGKIRGRAQAFTLSGSNNAAELEIDFVETK